jgi:hypothetical protein
MGQDLLSGTFEIVLLVLSIVLFLLWFFLPFAVFGIKGKLDEIIQQNNQLLSFLENLNTDTATISEKSTNKEKGVNNLSADTGPPNLVAGRFHQKQHPR